LKSTESSSGGYDFFTLDTRIETATIWLGDLFTTKHFNDDLVLITINDESEDFFGQDFDTSWRKKHALLIDLLSQAGTRTIAFAFMFSDPGPYDEEFIQAVRTANQRGTSVVVGMEQTGGFGVTDLDELRQAVSGYGPFCVGKKLGLASLAPLMIIKDDGSRVSSFILTAIAAYQGTPHYKLDREAKTIRFFGANSHQMENIHFSLLDEVKSDQGACQIRQGDVVADAFIDISPVETLRNPAREHAYHEFFQGKEPDQIQALKDKIVLVGKTDTDEMKYQVFNGFPSAGYQRYGLELVADAINTVMNGINIHSMGELGQLLIMIALGLLGGLVRYWVSPTRRYRRISIVIFILCMYLGSTIIIYAVYRVLLNTLYHVGALSIAYWATGKVERKWLA
jgi:CHASE2 domain-containing sensor protein